MGEWGGWGLGGWRWGGVGWGWGDRGEGGGRPRRGVELDLGIGGKKMEKKEGREETRSIETTVAD